MSGFVAVIIFFAVLALVVRAINVKGHESKEAERTCLNEERNTVVRTWLVDANGVRYETTSGGGVGRAIVGGALFGPVGAIVGAGTAKTETTAHDTKERKFIVEYTDGRREERVCKLDSDTYRLYMERLVMPG